MYVESNLYDQLGAGAFKALFSSLATASIGAAGAAYAAKAAAKAQSRAAGGAGAAYSAPNPFLPLPAASPGITQQKWFWPSVIGVGALVGLFVIMRVTRNR